MILLIFAILHQKVNPFLTENMNLLNYKSDLALIFLVLIQLLNYTYVDAYHMLAYFTLALGLIVKFYLISQVLKWVIFVNIIQHKKTICKFKKYGNKLISLVDGKKINKYIKLQYIFKFRETDRNGK